MFPRQSNELKEVNEESVEVNPFLKRSTWSDHVLHASELQVEKLMITLQDFHEQQYS